MKPRLYVMAAALLFSTGGAAIKGITLSSWQVASLRSLVAAIALPLLMPEARTLNLKRTWPAALAYATTLVLFVLATKLTTGANAAFLQSTAPFYLLAIGPLLLKERNGRGDYLLGAAIAIGMALFFLDSAGAAPLSPNPVLGNIFAAVSGFTWGLTVVALRRLSRGGGTGSLGVVTAGNALAFLFALPGAAPFPEIRGSDLLLLGYLGVFQIGLAYVCLTRGVSHVPAFETSALILLEPAMNPAWNYLIHGERVGPLSLAGGAVILAATLARSATEVQLQKNQSLPDSHKNGGTRAATPPVAP